MKNTNTLYFAALCCFVQISFAQNNVGIGIPNPNPSAILDVTASDKGVLVPRMNAAQRLAIISPALSLLVFDTDSNCFYFWRNTGWVNLCATGAGTTGTNGLDGATGVTGNPGINGVAGASGVTGLNGANGNNGTNGIDGVTGATGAIGVTGFGLQGITGDTGATGNN